MTEDRKHEMRLKLHYKKIDESISKERELTNESYHLCANLQGNATRKSIITLVINAVLWSVLLTGLTTLLYSDTIQKPLIVSIAIVTPPMFFITKTIIKVIQNGTAARIEENKKDTQNQIDSMYASVFNRQNLYDFLGIPHDIIFDGNDFPIIQYDCTELNKYGRFTRYITQSGKKYHLHEGCSGAYNSVHAYSIAQNSFYTPCSKCIHHNDPIYVPDWYIYYLKTSKIVKEHDISVPLKI